MTLRTKLLGLLIVTAFAWLLSGCQKAPEKQASVLEERARGLLRHEYFVECMKLLPKGPETTAYNDWDEVVAECSQQAYYQSNGAIPDGYKP